LATNNNKRINFASIKSVRDYPDFLDVQLKSFKDFFQLDTPAEKRDKEGLYKVFMENFPISDSRDNFVLEFVDYTVDPSKYNVEECIERGLTFSVPLKAKLRLLCNDEDNEDFQTIEQEVFLGNIPYMTERGSFVINGAERIIVSQLHRSPGVFFAQSKHTNGTLLYSARIIPFKGSWIEFAYNAYPQEGSVGRVQQLLQIARQFRQERGVPIYCGELGVYIPNSDPEDRNFWYQSVINYLEEHEIAWTSWDYQGGFGVFGENRNDLFEHDLNTDLLEAMGFKVPPQSPYMLLPDSVGFPIYQDYIEERMVASSWNEGVLDYYSEEGPHEGKFCIKWTQAAQFNHIGFDLKPNKDLSQLIKEGYALDFFVRGNTPG